MHLDPGAHLARLLQITDVPPQAIKGATAIIATSMN